MDVAVTIV